MKTSHATISASENIEPSFQKEKESEKINSRIKNFTGTLKQTQYADLKSQILKIGKNIEDSLIQLKINKQELKQEDDFSLTDQMTEYRNAQQKIKYYKEAILKLKVQMEGFYNSHKLQRYEDQIKHLNKELIAVEEENKTLKKMYAGNKEEVVNYLDKYENSDEIEMLNEKLNNMKNELKKSKEKLIFQNKELTKQQQIMVDKTEKLRSLKKEIQAKKYKKKVKNQTEIVKEPDYFLEISGLDVDIVKKEMKTLEEEITKLDKEIDFDDNFYSNELQKLKLDHQTELQNLKRIQTSINQRNNEIRIHEIKLRELKRSVSSKRITRNNSKSPELNISKNMQKSPKSSKYKLIPISPIHFKNKDSIQLSKINTSVGVSNKQYQTKNLRPLSILDKIKRNNKQKQEVEVFFNKLNEARLEISKDAKIGGYIKTLDSIHEITVDRKTPMPTIADKDS